jgi:hypothetical protein
MTSNDNQESGFGPVTSTETWESARNAMQTISQGIERLTGTYDDFHKQTGINLSNIENESD